MSYIVKAHNYKNQEKIFEGPLALLLELIEKEKLNITEVSLAQVADQFLNYLQNSKEISPENLADFLLVAGKLILIKSKALLPMLELSKEEEEDISDLKERLEEYKKFKETAQEIIKLESRNKKFFSRQSYFGFKTIFCPPQNFKLTDLENIFSDILEKIPKFESLPQETIKEIISIKDKIENLKQSLAERIEITFQEATVSANTKVEVIVIFLAMLELVRKNIIVAEQSDLFGEIKMKKLS